MVSVSGSPFQKVNIAIYDNIVFYDICYIFSLMSFFVFFFCFHFFHLLTYKFCIYIHNNDKRDGSYR